MARTKAVSFSEYESMKVPSPYPPDMTVGEWNDHLRSRGAHKSLYVMPHHLGVHIRGTKRRMAGNGH